LNRDEARAAAAFLNQGEGAFQRAYLVPGEPPWEVGQDEAGLCLFREPGGLCLIHPVKPSVCRLWPFLPSLLARESAFQEARCACPGFRAGLTWPEFRAAGAG
jgi:Fe-S-cluster containining protein